MTWRLRGVWLIAVLAVYGCSAPSPSPTAVAPIPHLASIQVQSQWVHTAPRNVRLSAIGIYTDDTRQILTSGVAWRCSEPNVATVSDAGVATFAGALEIRKHRRDEPGDPDHGSEAAYAAGSREAGEGLELLHDDRLVREECRQGVNSTSSNVAYPPRHAPRPRLQRARRARCASTSPQSGRRRRAKGSCGCNRLM